MKSFKLEKPNYSLKGALIAIATAFLAMVGGTLLGTLAKDSPPDVKTPQETTQEQPRIKEISTDTLFYYTNLERTTRGLAPLERLEALDMSAQLKANTIVAEDNYSHVDREGVRGAEYISSFTNSCTYGSENLNDNSQDSASTIDSWMNSTAHSQAILDTRYEYIGIGLSNGYAVQHFCDID